jgi:transposase InsO family protein
MLSILSSLVSLFFLSRKELALRLMVVSKEKEILERRINLNNIRVRFFSLDKLFISLLCNISKKAKAAVSLVQPSTLLKWCRDFIKKRWTFPNESKSVGRSSVASEVKQLILTMKNENIYMRTGKIQGELLKLGIDLSLSTIRRILRDFRKQGKLKSSLTWKQFITSHMSSLFSMDFFTVDSLFGKRFYVFFIMFIKTREIVQFGVTDIPSRRFVRNQLINCFEDTSKSKPYLIHDRSVELFYQDYESLGIRNVPTSIESPNMNAFAERFVGSIRREALDSFIIFNYGQLYSIVKEYITYYNNLRPHQGIDQDIPRGYSPQVSGTVVSSPVLSGLWHHYYRKAA